MVERVELDGIFALLESLSLTNEIEMAVDEAEAADRRDRSQCTDDVRSSFADSIGDDSADRHLERRPSLFYELCMVLSPIFAGELELEEIHR